MKETTKELGRTLLGAGIAAAVAYFGCRELAPVFNQVTDPLVQSCIRIGSTIAGTGIGTVLGLIVTQGIATMRGRGELGLVIGGTALSLFAGAAGGYTFAEYNLPPKAAHVMTLPAAPTSPALPSPSPPAA